MAMKLMRPKKETAWDQRLEEMFEDKDKKNTGMISLEEMNEIFDSFKMKLSISQVKPLLDSDGKIKKNDFVDYCVENKLFADNNKKDEEKEEKPDTNKRDKKKTSFFGFMKKKSSCQKSKLEKNLDKVEIAFKSMDKDGDGYIDWEEFKEVVGTKIGEEEAVKIFSNCDKSGDKRISLEEFRAMATSKREEAEEADRKFQNDLDKVEIAFRNLDKDGDGFIDWEEFREVAKGLDSQQAKQIFDACDKSGDKKISLEEFRDIANMKVM